MGCIPQKNHEVLLEGVFEERISCIHVAAVLSHTLVFSHAV